MINYLCLFIWLLQLVYGIGYIIADKHVHPAVFICAVLVCIFHYVGEII